MRIAYITTENPFNQSNNGGIGTYIGVISKGMSYSGHDVHIFTLGQETQEYIADSCHVTVVKASENKYTNYMEDSISLHQALSSKHQDKRFDVIESQEWKAPGYVTSLEVDAPFITRLHTPLFLIEQLNESRSFRESENIKRLEKRQTLLSNCVTSPSHSLKNVVMEEWNMDSIVIPNPINDISVLSNTNTDERLSGRYILYMGRLEHRKGVLTLAKAMLPLLKKTPSLKLLLCGSDTIYRKRSVKQQLLKLLDEVVDQVVFVDHIAGEKKVDLIKNCECMVLPSIWENFSYVALEALVLGTKVIASTGSGYEEMIHDGKTGVLFEVENSTELTSKIEVLMGNRLILDREKIRANTLEQFDISSLIGDYINLYERVIEGKSHEI